MLISILRRRFLIFLFTLIFSFSSFTSFAYSEELSDIDQILSFWRTWSPQCESYPSKQDCDDGDMTLFNGLLCASGESLGCEAVRLSQAEDGGWYRSPRLVGTRGTNKTSFSRDMSMGAMLYLVKTRDINAAESWLNWINKNRPCVLENPFGDGCLSYGFHRYCRDEKNQSCTLTPASWGIMDKVWRYLGLNPSGQMAFYRGMDEDFSVLEAMFNSGYARHLKGVYSLLLHLMDKSPDIQNRLNSILASAQPNNPFFRYLEEGKTDEIKELVLELCPAPSEGEPSRKAQWSWERDEDERAWKDSMGWDCIFMANLLNSKE